MEKQLDNYTLPSRAPLPRGRRVFVGLNWDRDGVYPVYVQPDGVYVTPDVSDDGITWRSWCGCSLVWQGGVGMWCRWVD